MHTICQCDNVEMQLVHSRMQVLFILLKNQSISKYTLNQHTGQCVANKIAFHTRTSAFNTDAEDNTIKVSTDVKGIVHR